MTELDELFVDAKKILEQQHYEEIFIGRVLSKFTNLENIVSRIIALHICSKENVGKFMLNEAHEMPSHKKIQILSQILKRSEYKKPDLCSDNMIEQLFNLKKIRNQLAHNIIDPHESFESAKTESKDIVFRVMTSGKIKQERFSEEEQDSLIDRLDSMRCILKELHGFVKKKNGDYQPEWYPS